MYELAKEWLMQKGKLNSMNIIIYTYYLVFKVHMKEHSWSILRIYKNIFYFKKITQSLNRYTFGPSWLPIYAKSALYKVCVQAKLFSIAENDT